VRIGSLTLGVAFCSVLGGCDLISPRACTSDLRWSVEPIESTLRVGQGFTAKAEAFGCGGRDRLPVDMRWSSSDAAVISVEERSGRVVAVGTGRAQVSGQDLGRYGIGPFQIPVVVQ
jgi:hypothetical protein